MDAGRRHGRARRLGYLGLRLLNVAAYPLARLYWRIAGARSRGVMVLLHHDDRVLLVKQSYGTRRWTLPGGSVGAGETLEEAARRETREEVGVKVGALTLVGTIRSRKEGRRDTTTVFRADVPDEQFCSNTWEIEDARWFPIADLLAGRLPLSHGMREALRLAGY